MKNSESEILADVYEKVRGLSKMFISGLKDVDINKRLEIDNIKFNSAYWIVAHLVWTEHFLLVQGVGGENMKIEWLDEYAYGTDPDSVKTKPPYEEILKRLDEVHAKAVEIIKGLSDEQLEEDNLIGANFGGSKAKRNVITHAIRHEPMHIGQISWILKSNGIKYA
ncbi:MAG TPA: DinB family protein [Ignavibacteria bacterium]|nr:DinB family protein [Ignavibacteria bacterium]